MRPMRSAPPPSDPPRLVRLFLDPERQKGVDVTYIIAGGALKYMDPQGMGALVEVSESPGA
jgi:hypothetical protein